jgi:hypothetical protein
MLLQPKAGASQPARLEQDLFWPPTLFCFGNQTPLQLFIRNSDENRIWRTMRLWWCLSEPP